MNDIVTPRGAPLPMISPTPHRQAPEPTPEVRRVAEEFEVRVPR